MNGVAPNGVPGRLGAGSVEQIAQKRAALRITVVVVIMAALRVAIGGRPARRHASLAFENPVQFPAIQPDTVALRTEVDLDTRRSDIVSVSLQLGHFMRHAHPLRLRARLAHAERGRECRAR